MQLEIDACDAREAFVEAARAICELIAGDEPLGPLQEPEPVFLRASDAESLLVDWINELIYLGEIRKCVYPEVAIEELSLQEPCCARACVAQSRRC